MSKKIILIAGVVLVVVIFFSLRNPVRRAVGVLAQAEYVIDLAERLQGLLEVNTAELNRVSREWRQSQKEIEKLNTEVRDNLLEIKALQQQLDALPTYEIPEPSTVHPIDYEECLIELERSRLRGDTLVMIIDTHREEITLLRALNTSQGLIISSQAEIIDKQSSYIAEFEFLLKEHSRRVNRRIFIVSAVGLAIALIL